MGPFALVEVGPSCLFSGNIVPLLGNVIFCGIGGSGGMEKNQEKKKQLTKEELLKSVVSLLLCC